MKIGKKIWKMCILFVMSVIYIGCSKEKTDSAITQENKYTEDTSSVSNKITEEDRYGAPVIENGIQYTPLTFVDSIQLKREKDKGWIIDLNGDGEQEKLYAGEDGLYINGLCVWSDKGNTEILFPKDFFWLLDIDTTDGYIEILIDRYSYSLAYYTENSELVVQPNVCGYYDTFDYENATDIRKPVRIDEHTVSFFDGHSEFSFHQATMNYRLDEKHKLVVIPGEYEIDFPHPFAYLNQEVPLRLFQERDLNGKYLEVLGPQVYMFNKSDGTGWIYLENYFGESGWIYTGKNEAGVWCINQIPYTQGDFIGFSNVP